MSEFATQHRLALEPQGGIEEGAGDNMAIPMSEAGEERLVKYDRPGTDGLEKGELIEPGRALVLSDFTPPDISAGERLIRLAYRLGVPGSTLSAPFRKRATPRLLATVETPLTGDRVGGMALRAGHFLVYGVKAPIGQMDLSSGARLTPPFENVVHGFSWLRDLSASAPVQQCTPTAERILFAWLDANPHPAKGTAWKIGIGAHRLLAWLVHAPLTMASSDRNARLRVLAAAVETARWLDRSVGRAEDKLAEVSAWCAITAAGLLLPDGKPRRLFGESGLVRALGDLVGDDGGVLSRSPLDQIEAIELLVELSACYRAVRRDPPQALDTMMQMLVPPLLGLTHSDGSLGSWQGAASVPAAKIAALVEASGVRTRPLRDARQWGYQRVASSRSVLQFDAAPPPLARHSRHGSASTLAFEMSHRGQRLVVNCGGAAVAGGQVPVRIEQGLRASAAHSTLVLGDANSTAVLINGKLGSGVAEVEVDRRVIELENGTATRIEASHDGYVARFGLVHRRILIMRDDGTELRGEDLLIPSGRKGKRGKVAYAIRFHLGPGIDVTLTDSARGAHLACPDGDYWQFVCGTGEVQIEESLWVDGDGRPQAVQQLAIEGMVSRGGGNFSWLLKKMG